MTSLSSVVAQEVDRENGNALLITTHVSVSDFPSISPYIFRLNTILRDEINVIYKNLIEHFGFKRPAIYFSNNDYGKDVYEHFIELAKNDGVEVVVSETFNVGQLDHKPSLFKIKEQNPDVCLFVGNDQTAAIAMRQAMVLGLNCQYVATATSGTRESFELSGEAAERLLYTATSIDNVHFITPNQLKFKQDYEQKYNDITDIISTNPYAAFEMFVAGLKASPSLEPKVVAETLLSLKDVETIYGTLAFDKDGDVHVKVMMFRYQKGQSIPVE
jgi:branched-chain amino acid transport system substrate-binding protein